MKKMNSCQLYTQKTHILVINFRMVVIKTNTIKDGEILTVHTIVVYGTMPVHIQELLNQRIKYMKMLKT